MSSARKPLPLILSPAAKHPVTTLSEPLKLFALLRQQVRPGGWKVSRLFLWTMCGLASNKGRLVWNKMRRLNPANSEHYPAHQNNIGIRHKFTGTDHGFGRASF